jgi:hypothetical protein
MADTNLQATNTKRAVEYRFVERETEPEEEMCVCSVLAPL